MEMMKVQNKPKKQKRQRNLTKYCHTHGLCNHTSPKCRTPTEGHKNKTTLQNRMGGSVKNITWKDGPIDSTKIDCKINNFTTKNTLPIAHPNQYNTSIIMKAGASKHFVKNTEAQLLKNLKNSKSTTVILPDKTNLATHKQGHYLCQLIYRLEHKRDMS